MIYLVAVILCLVLFFVVIGAVQASREGRLGEYLGDLFCFMLLSFLWDD